MFSSLWKSSSSAPSSTGGGFDVEEPVDLPQVEKHLFNKHHRGRIRSTGATCSVFECDQTDLLQVAAAAVKRLKTLRHPSIATYLDSAETSTKVTVVTEPLTPLSRHLDDLDRAGVRGGPRDEYLAWGVYQVFRAVSFLNNDAKLSHNQLHGDAIFVSKSGDWKLFGLERVGPADPESYPAAPRLHSLQKYEPPETSDPSKMKTATAWSKDMWGVGCVIWEAFNGPLPAARNLGQLGSIPKKLQQLYMEVVAANPAKRPNPKDRLETLRRPGGYFKNKQVDALLFLEEIHLKDEAEKGRFYSSLSQLVEDVPPHVANHKILPGLVKTLEFGSSGSAAAILGPVLKIGKKLTPEEYVELVVPCVVKMFASSDRNARFKLLSQMELFAEHLSEKLVNDEVFPKLEGGFMDGEPAIREKTVIAVVHLAPKMSRSNLDDNVVMKHFARLLRDEQPGIRTNTTVCLGKIARYLHYSTRQKVLLAAFTGKLRDPFPPSRIAAINALAATQQYFTLSETSGRLLPALCQTLTDAEEPVRQQAFKVLRGFVEKLEQVSKDPSLKEEMEAEVLSTISKANTSSVAGWANWAVGAIGAKFYKSATPKPQEQQQQQQQQQQQSRPETRPQNSDRSSEVTTVSMSSSDNASNSMSALSLDGDGDNGNNANDGWDDADDGDWGSLEDNNGSSGKKEEETTTNNAWARNTSKKVEEEDAWDSWGDPVPIESKTNTTQEESRRLRQEKMAQRKKELAAKREARARAGPMKLGAKKD